MGNFIQTYRLRYLTEENTPEYGFSDQRIIGKIVSVYDGDTCTAIVCINGRYQRIKIRCQGYDSPELRPSKNLPNRYQEISKAKDAKTALERFCLNKIVKLHIHGFDKYGRFLATIYIKKICGKVNINQEMLRAGHGYEYYGGKKRDPDQV